MLSKVYRVSFSALGIKHGWAGAHSVGNAPVCRVFLFIFLSFFSRFLWSLLLLLFALRRKTAARRTAAPTTVPTWVRRHPVAFLSAALCALDNTVRVPSASRITLNSERASGLLVVLIPSFILFSLSLALFFTSELKLFTGDRCELLAAAISPLQRFGFIELEVAVIVVVAVIVAVIVVGSGPFENIRSRICSVSVRVGFGGRVLVLANVCHDVCRWGMAMKLRQSFRVWAAEKRVWRRCIAGFDCFRQLGGEGGRVAKWRFWP